MEFTVTTMEFTEWEPVYEAILADFGYDLAADERARDVLGGYAVPFDLDRIDVAGSTVAIAGGAGTLARELEVVERADAVFAASTAADVLAECGIDVDCMVTDLDKNPETVRRFTNRGAPVAVHAHGDNVPAIREHLPELDVSNVLATTQARPLDAVENHGGFTDGDRAAFLADHLGAAELVFPGWAFDDPHVDGEKRRKLAWAERLLAWLERRRGERFDVLDGRRDGLELPSPPF